jgi:hypothetical protein
LAAGTEEHPAIITTSKRTNKKTSRIFILITSKALSFPFKLSI